MNNEMEKVTVKNSYDVFIGRDISEMIVDLTGKSAKARKVLIISDDNTHALFLEKYLSILSDIGYEVFDSSVPPGDNSKSLHAYMEILEFLSEKRLTRTDIIIALGGGVVGDLAGFTAGTYLRGIDYYQIPTTLLAAVDSSIGGKTGVNLSTGKNLAGVFWQPKGVLCDSDNLETQPEGVKIDGIAEIIKYGMICDRNLFDKTDRKSFDDELVGIIKRCVEIKAEIVGKDETDKGIRKLLNFGHTIGHAIEKLSNYDISHGNAVAIGMVAISKASAGANLCSRHTVNELTDKLKSFGLPTETTFSMKDIVDVALNDKKISGKNIDEIIPLEVGKCIIKTMSLTDFKSLMENSGSN